LQVNPQGDMGCIMGYGEGRFFNVAIANLILGIATPILSLKIGGDKAAFNAAAKNMTIPAMELTSANHVIMTFPIPVSYLTATRSYFVSYHKVFDKTLAGGFYDLTEKSLAGKVHVHMKESYKPRASACQSVLMAVISPGGQTTVDNLFSVSCSRAGTIDAQVTIAFL
jgi:hypothetical protein